MWFVKNIFFIKWIYIFFKKRTPKMKDKIEEVKEDYTKLLAEYKKIEEKTSDLPRSKRNEIQQRVIFLIGKGHIKSK